MAVPYEIAESRETTRRGILKACLGVPLSLSVAPLWAKDFWESKPSSEWTTEEIREMLTKSPWAKSASISYDDVPAGGGLGSIGGVMSGRSSGGRRAAPSGSKGREPASGENQRFEAVVRWDSSLPVREALKSKPSPEEDSHYVLNVAGDLPSMSSNGEDEALDQRRLEMLQQYTRLESRNAIFLARIQPAPAASGPGTLFYFPRSSPITLEDKQVTFSTKIGPLEIKAKFTLKDMLYRGKLEL